MSYSALFAKLVRGLSDKTWNTTIEVNGKRVDTGVQLLVDTLVDILRDTNPIELGSPLKLHASGNFAPVSIYSEKDAQRGIEYRNGSDVVAEYGPRAAIFTTLDRPYADGDVSATQRNQYNQMVVGPGYGRANAPLGISKPITDPNDLDSYRQAIRNRLIRVDGSEPAFDEAGGGGGENRPPLYNVPPALGVSREPMPVDTSGVPHPVVPSAAQPIRVFRSTAAFSQGDDIEAVMLEGSTSTGVTYDVNTDFFGGTYVPGTDFPAYLDAFSGEWKAIGSGGHSGGVELVSDIANATVNGDDTVTVEWNTKTLTFSNGLLTGVASTSEDDSGGWVMPATPSTAATYVTLTTDASLTNERTLAVGNGLDMTDGGAGNAVTLAVDETELDHNSLSGLLVTGGTDYYHVDVNFITFVASLVSNGLFTLNGTTNQVSVSPNIVNHADTITISLPQDIHTGASPGFSGLTLSGLTSNRIVTTTTGGQITTAAALTNGQLLIGSTGAAPSAASITGTANQITVTGGAGSITLATPQDIHTDADVAFDTLTLSPGTLGTNERVVSVTATHPATTGDGATGPVRFDITSAGSDAGIRRALLALLRAGYTGSSRTACLEFSNATAGTGTDWGAFTCNIGCGGTANGTTTGTNLAGFGNAENGNINIGWLGRSITDKNSATNIGLVGLGHNDGTSPGRIGVVGALENGTFSLTENCGGYFTNGDHTDAILIGADNATGVFYVKDGGTVIAGNGTTVTAAAVTGAIQCNKTDGAAYIISSRWQNSAVGGAGFIGAMSRSTTIGSFSAVSSGDGLCQLIACGDNGSSLVESGKLRWVSTGTASTTIPCAFAVTTGDGSTTNEVFRATARKNFLIGTTTDATANDGKVLILGDNGASDPTLGANTCAIYQKSGEIYHKDAAGNASLQSPHAKDSPGGVDTDFDMILRNENARLGKKEWIHLSRMARVLERLTGERFLYEETI